MFRLLHISDLHRAPSDPVGNAELISTLLADHDRHSRDSTPIGKYDAAIISGDIVQGIDLHDTNADAELIQQYDAAYEFLAELADRFFAGDRSRMVVVPGNHDVDWNTARNSMIVVDDPDKPVKQLLTIANSPFRWDWNSKRLFLIKDRSLYEKRLDHYREFHRHFYEHSSVPIYSDPNGYFDLFELDIGRIVVAAFNSCHENDCYRDQGAIAEEAIGRAHLAIRDRGRRYALKMAVWHHSIEGPPGLSDYMDGALVARMIDRGFRLGLHGHQHHAEAATHRINLPEKTDMVVVSAGSLCAGARELPVGMQRQYNVIEISDTFDSCRVHVREVTSANVFTPSTRAFAGASYIDLQWSADRNEMGDAVDWNVEETRAVVLHAEELAQANDADGAVTLLRDHLSSLPAYGRKLLLDNAVIANRWADILLIANPTISIDELVSYVEAAIRLNKHDLAQSSLDENASEVGLEDSQRRELSARIEATRIIHNG